MIADRHLLSRFWAYLRPHQRWVWGAMCLIPIATLCQLAGPLIIKYAIDEHVMTGALGPLRWDALAFLGVLLLEYVARVGERFALVRCGIFTLRDVRQGLMRHLTTQPVGMFERRPLGALVSRVTSDVEALMETISTGVITIVSDVLLLLGILVAMAWLNLQLTWVTVLSVLPVALLVNWYRKRLRTNYDRVRRHTGRMNGILNETVVGMQEMQLFNYQPAMQRRFAHANRDHFRDSMRVVGSDATLYSFVEGMGVLTIAIMAWYGIRLVMEDVITIGVLIAFLTYIQRFYSPIKEFSSKMAVVQGGLAAMHRIVEVLERDERPSWGDARPTRQEPTVEFERVWFVYPQRLAQLRGDAQHAIVGLAAERPLEESQDVAPDVAQRPAEARGNEPLPSDGLYALRGLSFEVQPGERVALVGWTGAGKSTVVKLLAGLYRPLRGRVLMDGRPISAYDQHAFQRCVGVVPQDVYLFADTVAFNVGLGNPKISRATIEEACRVVQADGFIRGLARGYDTILGTGGRTLSQGQRQLVAFARILAWSPALVILDEATASVDSRSEQLIQEAIAEVLRRTTTIVIAHRLSTIRHVDRILVLHEGRLVESGTHAALLARGGYYRDLLDAQFTGRGNGHADRPGAGRLGRPLGRPHVR